MRDLNSQIADLRARQASAWVTALAHAGETLPAEFVVWLKESPLNVHEFLVAYTIDQQLESPTLKVPHSVAELLARSQASVTPFPGLTAAAPSPPAEPRLSRRRGLALAASVLVALVAGGWLFSSQQTGWEEFRTGSGERGTLQLGDGSVVRLNAHSSIALKFSATSREVKLLDGEALFEVHHDAHRPFRVSTRDTVIEDIGTRFDVYSRSDGVRVAVIEGSVQVTARPTAMSSAASTRAAGAPRPLRRVLTANQQAQIERGDIIALDELPDISQTISWPQQRRVYRKEPLARIVEDFNRSGWHQIRLEGEAVKQRPYTGLFDPEDPDSLAAVLAQDPELKVERSGDSIVVRERTASP